MAALAVELVIGLGGIILSALFTPKPKDHQGSRISNINITPVSPGNPIPRVWGTFKVPAQMIFASPLIETMHTHQVSSKGGGKGSSGGKTATTYTYTYSVDLAFAVCAGPIYQINRIWAQQKLLYVNPVVLSHTAQDFAAAYQSEATRLIDEEGVDMNHAACSAFVFAWNNYETAEVTLNTPADALTYIVANPIDDTQGITGQILHPDYFTCYSIISSLYSSLNKDNTYESTIYRYDNIELYTGNEQQEPNSLLEAYLGSGNVPAFRGCAYFVITNLQLADFGNNVPQMTVEVQRTPAGTTDLVQILTDVCYQAGLTEDQFAFSDIDQTPFPGFAITANTSAREIVSDLQKVFPIDAAESGFRIIFSQVNKRANQIWNRVDLGAHQDTEPLPASQEITVASDYDFPYRVNLKYQEPARNFSPNTLYATRQNTPSLGVEDLDVTIALARADAQKAVANYLMNRMMGRRAYTMQLPRQYATAEPTDVIKIPNKVDPTHFDEYYVTQVDIGANGIVKVSAVDHSFIDPNLAPTDQVATDEDVAIGSANALPTTCQTVPFLFDCPLLLDTDADNPGFYVVLAGAFEAWSGGQLFVDLAAPSKATAYGQEVTTPTSGSAWVNIASNAVNVPQGVCFNTLAAGVHPGYFDRVTDLVVRISNGMGLVNANESDMLIQNLNVAMIGGEVVQYANAVDLGNGTWKLSNFLRGLRGTERYMDGHVIGETFVRLTTSLQRLVTTTADLNQTDSFQAITVGSSSSTAVSLSFSDTGNSLRPLTPAVYQRFRDAGTGDVTISWWPRVRQNGQWLSGADVAVSANDTPETYQVDVYTANWGAVAKTYTVSGSLGASWTYTASAQTTDLGSPADPVLLVFYQMSQIIGRGFGLSVVV